MVKNKKRSVISVIILAIMSLLASAWVFGVWIDQCGFRTADVGWSSWHTNAWDVAMPVSAFALGFFACILFKRRGKIAALLYSLVLSALLCSLPWSLWSHGSYLTLSVAIRELLGNSILVFPLVLTGFIIAQSIIYMCEHFVYLRLAKSTDEVLYGAGVKKTLVMSAAIFVSVIATVCYILGYGVSYEKPLLYKILYIISSVLLIVVGAVLSAQCKGWRKLFVILSAYAICIATFSVSLAIYCIVANKAIGEMLLVSLIPVYTWELVDVLPPVIPMAIGSFASVGIGAILKKISAKKASNSPETENESADTSEA